MTHAARPENGIARIAARALALLIACNIGLLWAGILVLPRAFTSIADSGGLLAATLMQALYGFVLLFSQAAITRGDSRVVRLSLQLGAVYGVVYGALMLSEYIVPVTTGLSEQTGTAAVVTLVAICLVAGIAASRRTGTIWQAGLAAVWAAMVGTLIWAGAYLAMTYALWGTETQQMVLQAEGTYQDFIADGGGDFAVFLIRDIQGAAFFHTLLSPVVAAVLGPAGWGLGLVTRRLLAVVRPDIGAR
jgi:hypothetical protein